MTETTSLPLFLISIIAVSLTGAIMPGPVTAVTITKGYLHKEAGAFIAVGHGIIEFPLIALLSFGFTSYLKLMEVRVTIGLIGGIVLLWMALSILKSNDQYFADIKDESRGSIVIGLITTVSNPYFFIWWASIGASLLASAQNFGKVGVIAFSITHWLCDAAWLFLVSWLIFKSKSLWTDKLYHRVLKICAAILFGFGGWFIYNSIRIAMIG